MKILAKFFLNWADETDEEGFAIYTPEEWEVKKKILSEPRDFSFGTNEGWEDEVFLDAITTEEITDELAGMLYALFPELVKETHEYEHLGKKRSFTSGGTYGTFPDLNSNEEDEE